MGYAQLVTQGKILYWGTSEWTAEEIEQAYTFAIENHLTPPSMEQPQYNLLDRDRFEVEYEPIFKKYGMGTTTWSPLASGALTGKYLTGIPKGSRASLEGYEWLKRHMIESDRGQNRMKQVANFIKLAAAYDLSPSKLAIAWCLLNKNVSTVDPINEEVKGATGALEYLGSLQDDGLIKKLGNI